MYVLMIALFSFFQTTLRWETDFEKAREIAGTEHKYILLNFSGSDWCAPCIRMHRELFESKVFGEYASASLVLVNADFPRLKKNQLTKEARKRNERLAEVYNKEGAFPLTLLINRDGKVLKKWEGFPNGSPAAFVDEIIHQSHASN